MKYEDYMVLLINTVIQDRENMKLAFRQGKTIQYRTRNNKTMKNIWHTAVTPIWRFDLNEYRVKPIASKTDIVHDTWKKAKADPNYKTDITLKVVDMDTGEDMEIPKGNLSTFWNTNDYDNDDTDKKALTAAAAKFQIQTLAENLGFVVEDRHIRVIGNDQKVDSTPKKPRSHMRQADVAPLTDQKHLEARLQALDKRLTEVEDTING